MLICCVCAGSRRPLPVNVTSIVVWKKSFHSKKMTLFIWHTANLSCQLLSWTILLMVWWYLPSAKNQHSQPSPGRIISCCDVAPFYFFAGRHKTAVQLFAVPPINSCNMFVFSWGFYLRWLKWYTAMKYCNIGWNQCQSGELITRAIFLEQKLKYLQCWQQSFVIESRGPHTTFLMAIGTNIWHP